MLPVATKYQFFRHIYATLQEKRTKNKSRELYFSADASVSKDQAVQDFDSDTSGSNPTQLEAVLDIE